DGPRSLPLPYRRVSTVRTHTVMIGESVPLGGAVQHLIEPADRVILPFWPADPQLGPMAWPHGGVEVLMPGRWTPPIGVGVHYGRGTYPDHARASPGLVDTLVVAAMRHGDGWVLPWTAGTTGAVATSGVDRVAVVEATDRTVVPGAP